EFNPFLVQRLRKEPWEMFVAHEILHDSKFVMYTVICQGTVIFVSIEKGEHAGIQKGSLRVSGGRDDARHGWPLEGHDSVAPAGWAETHQRTQTFDSRHHRTNADPASSGTGCRWHRQKRRQTNHPALRLLFAFL